MGQYLAQSGSVRLAPVTNLLLFNLATDADDPLLGFTTTWLNRLAACYSHVDVITMRVGRLAVAPNVSVYSVGKEQGLSEARRGIRFYRLLSRLLRQRSYGACFAHMMPLFAAMGAPLLRTQGVPLILWYTHRQTHRTLKIATAASYRVVTAASGSFPLQTDKLRVIGHGIDTDFFAPAPLKAAPESHYVVHVARLMPIKHQATLIRALVDLPDAHAVFIGDVPPGKDAAYHHELEKLAADLGVDSRITFTGSLSAEDVRDWLRRAAVAVNLSPPGLFDKAALESMAVAVPTLVSSHAFADLLPDETPALPAPDDAAALAARLEHLLSLSPVERQSIGSEQRQRVSAAHSLDVLIERLVSVLNTGEPQ